MKDWTVTIRFGGFIGCSNEYTVYAETEEEAREETLQMAYDDIEVEDIVAEEDDEE